MQLNKNFLILISASLISLILLYISIVFLYYNDNITTKSELNTNEPLYDNFIIREYLTPPNNESISINFIMSEDIDAYVEYGIQEGIYKYKSNILNCTKFTSSAIQLNNLNKNTQYYYRLVYKKSNTSNYLYGNEYSFKTKKNSENDFSFTVQSDIFREKTFSNELYTKPYITF